MNNRPTSPLLRALDSLLEGTAGSWVINLLVIPLLVILALVLPPLAFPQRILSAGYTGVSATGGSVSVPDGAQLAVPPGTIKSSVNIKLGVQSRDAFLKSALAQNLPATLDVKSPLYQPSLQGTAPAQTILSIPIPDGADPFDTLDVYGYSNKKWVKLPYQLYLDEQRLEAYLPSMMPQGVVVGQTGAQPPTLSVDLAAKTKLPASAAPLIAEVNPIGLTIADGGGIAGSVPNMPETSASSPYQVLPTVSNFDGEKYRGEIVADMLKNPDTRKQHVQALVDLAVEKLYPGLNLDYQDLNPENQKALTTFIRELATALHVKEKLLSVTLSVPEQKSVDTWDTGAFEWDAIGQAADIVKIPLHNYREAYVGETNSPVNAYLQWAVGRVDRYKMQLMFSTLGRDEFGTAYAPVSFATVSKMLGQPELPANIVPDTKVTLDLPKLREGGIKFDAPTGWHYFSYKDEKGLPHTVYIETADSLAKRIALVQQFNLRGIALRDLSGEAVDARVWDALKKYSEAKTPTYKSRAVIVWQVNGKAVGTSPATDPRFAWTVPAQVGEVKIEAALSFDEGQSNVGTTTTTVAQVVKPQPTPAPTAVAKPAAAPAGPAPAGPAPAAPASAFRGKNLFGYGIQVHGGDPNGEAADIKALGFNWVKVQMPWKDVESNKGGYNWSSYDNFVNVMSGSGINVLLSIVKAPRWSRTVNYSGGSHGDEGPPDNMQDAADFMGLAAARYCGKVGGIEVWNEGNLDVEWHDKRGLSAALSMEMQKKAYIAIKAKCPGIVVVSGAPTPNGMNNATAIDDVAWMHQLYQNGLKDYSDAIGAHPSGFRSPPDIPAGNLGSYADHRSFFFRGTMDAYRAVMVQYGDRDKQIWATEFGWPVGTGGGAHPAGQFNSPETAADYYVRAYQWAKAQGWVGVMFAWQLDFSGGEVGAFRIKGAPAFGRLQSMPK